VLRYTKGQFYRTHHDMSPGDMDLACGPRILTFFLYLSDVDEGGGTNFPRLDLTVRRVIFVLFVMVVVAGFVGVVVEGVNGGSVVVRCVVTVESLHALKVHCARSL